MHFVFEVLQIHDRNSVHILLQSTPDSIIDGVYVQTVWRPDRRLDEVGYVLLQRLDCQFRHYDVTMCSPLCFL